MPKVSVIIPSYNHENFVAEAIQSVLNQTYQDFEIVITDDGSTDNTVNIIRQFTDPRIRLFCFTKNRGAAVAANNCLKEARGEFIAMLSSDDVFAIDKLEKQAKFLDEHLEVGAVFSYAHIIDENGNDFTQEKHAYKEIFIQSNRNRFKWLNRFFFQGNCLCHPSALIRKKCYEDVGQYDERFAQLPDFDFWIRLCMKYEIYVMPEELIKFRIRDNEANASGNRPEAKIRLQIEHKQILKNYFSAEVRRYFSEIFPEAGQEINNKDDVESIDLKIAMLAIQVGNPAYQCFGIDKIYDLLALVNNKRNIKIEYDIDAASLIKLTGQYDVFGIFSAEKLHLQIGQMQSELEYLHSQLQLTQAELKVSRVVIQEQQAELEKSQSQSQQTQAELERSQSQLQQTQAELKRSQSQLQQTQTELERSQSQLQQTQAELERSQSQLQQTQAELERSQSQLQQTHVELERSHSRQQETQIELENLKYEPEQYQLGWEKAQIQLRQAQKGWERAQTIIIAMESSKFWKLRKIWFRIKRSSGLISK